MNIEESRTNLHVAAKEYAAATGASRTPAWEKLCVASVDFTKAQQASNRSANEGDSDAVIPFGKSKGTPLGEATDKDIKWFMGILPANVDDPTKARWKAANEKLLAAFEAEAERRGL